MSPTLNPYREHDACGVGFVAHPRLSSHRILRLALEGLPLLGWRSVPVRTDRLGRAAEAGRPAIFHAFVGPRATGTSTNGNERSIWRDASPGSVRAAELLSQLDGDPAGFPEGGPLNSGLWSKIGRRS